MNILFDLLGAQPSGNSKFHGGGEYIKTVFKRLVEMNCGRANIYVFFDKTKFLDQWVLNLVSSYCNGSFNICSYAQLKDLAAEMQVDVFYSGLPYGISQKYFQSATYIGTFHGTRNIDLPSDKYAYLYRKDFYGKSKEIVKHFLLRRYVLNRNKKKYMMALEKFDKIVVVSDTTKKLINEYFPNFNGNISVFYTPAKYLQTERISNICDFRYILLLGVNRLEKNGYRAILALEKLFAEGELSNYKVVTVGQIPGTFRDKMKHADKYIEYQYVAPDVLEDLYLNCDFFIYPTLTEGFGMPPLEAMKYGKTCVVSNLTSVPEVCGDVVYYFNPYDVNEMAKQILVASMCKMDIEKIKRHFELIRRKQDIDLVALCELILCGAK